MVVLGGGAVSCEQVTPVARGLLPPALKTGPNSRFQDTLVCTAGRRHPASSDSNPGARKYGLAPTRRVSCRSLLGTARTLDVGILLGGARNTRNIENNMRAASRVECLESSGCPHLVSESKKYFSPPAFGFQVERGWVGGGRFRSETPSRQFDPGRS